MANPGHLTIVLIRMWRALTVSVSFSSLQADLVLILRTHLPLLSKASLHSCPLSFLLYPLLSYL